MILAFHVTPQPRAQGLCDKDKVYRKSGLLPGTAKLLDR